MIILTDEDREFRDDILFLKPFFTDCCDHPPESYVCSFVQKGYIDHETKKRVDCERKYDLYVYPTQEGYDVCIRTGNEPGEYISPGDAIEFLLRSGTFYADRSMWATCPLTLARNILLNYGKLSYTVNHDQNKVRPVPEPAGATQLNGCVSLLRAPCCSGVTAP